MDSNIQNITIYDDGCIEMVVMCNICGYINTHSINNATVKNDGKRIIHFSKLGKRCCDNHPIPQVPDSGCYADYNLYI